MIAWIFLLLGGLCEIGFVSMMKLSDGFSKFKYTTMTILFMVASFFTLSMALKTIPIGTGYAVWAGIGAVGSVIVGVFYFKEERSTAKLLCIVLIIAGITGLKLSTN